MNEQYEKLKDIVNHGVSADSRIVSVTAFSVEDKELMMAMCRLMAEFNYTSMQFKDLSTGICYLVTYGLGVEP